QQRAGHVDDGHDHHQHDHHDHVRVQQLQPGEDLGELLLYGDGAQPFRQVFAVDLVVQCFEVAVIVHGHFEPAAVVLVAAAVAAAFHADVLHDLFVPQARDGEADRVRNDVHAGRIGDGALVVVHDKREGGVPGRSSTWLAQLI